MKPDTIEDDFAKVFQHDLCELKSKNPNVWQSRWHDIVAYISSSQALARREGIVEAIKAVEAFRKDWEISFNDDIRNRFIEKILEALQEKLDTKGE